MIDPPSPVCLVGKAFPNGRPEPGDAATSVDGCFRAGLLYHEEIIAPGAQTKRQGDAGPVRVGLAADTHRPLSLPIDFGHQGLA
jgi:hypothetical protein